MDSELTKLIVARNGTEEQPAAQSRDNDISHFITSVSKEPIYTRGRFGDVFTGIHKVVGKIALKRIRVGDTCTEEEAFRVRSMAADP